MKYWDASALVPVIFEEEGRNELGRLMEGDSIAAARAEGFTVLPA